MYGLNKTALLPAVTLALLLGLTAPVFAQSIAADLAVAAELDGLHAQLQSPDLADWSKVEDQIARLWSKSGSDSADLLLERGREAIEAEEFVIAIEHLTALTDHAPEFAEGWNMRATAFYLMDEYGLAMLDIERTLALNPRHFGAIAGLGLIYEELGDDNRALAAFRIAHDLNPHRENITEAIERLSQAVEGMTL